MNLPAAAQASNSLHDSIPDESRRTVKNQERNATEDRYKVVELSSPAHGGAKLRTIVDDGSQKQPQRGVGQVPAEQAKLFSRVERSYGYAKGGGEYLPSAADYQPLE